MIILHFGTKVTQTVSVRLVQATKLGRPRGPLGRDK